MTSESYVQAEEDHCKGHLGSTPKQAKTIERGGSEVAICGETHTTGMAS